MDTAALYVLGPVAVTTAGAVLVAWLRVRARPARPAPTPRAPCPEAERVDVLHRWASDHYRATTGALAALERRVAQLETEAARDSDAGEIRELRKQLQEILHAIGHVEGVLATLSPHSAHPAPSERFRR